MLGIQDMAEFVEIKMSPPGQPTPAKRVVPSAEEAIQPQLAEGAAVGDQLMPESVDR